MNTEELTAALLDVIDSAQRGKLLAKEWMRYDYAVYLRDRHQAEGRAMAAIQLAEKFGLPDVANEARKIWLS